MIPKTPALPGAPLRASKAPLGPNLGMVPRCGEDSAHIGEDAAPRPWESSPRLSHPDARDARLATMSLLIDGHWLPANRCDPRAIALYFRHYSSRKGGRKPSTYTHGFVGQGEDMTLLTERCDALFAWVRQTVPRMDGQVGVNCTVFRNESPILSSLLIEEAVQLAWLRWPGARLFTYVNPSAIRSSNPGYCFLRAGFCRVPRASRLVLLERFP